jgi:hypothetical protein
MKKTKFERKLILKKESISQLQPAELRNIKGGTEEEVITSIISCVTNGRTCGTNCCGTDTRHAGCSCCGCY